MTWWERAGRIGGYGAAVAMTPYPLIKISWVLGALLGLLPTGSDTSLLAWVVLNGATVVMAGVGILLALALVRPWGTRIPAAPLALTAWIGAGFLVSVLPFALVSSALDAGAGEADPDPGAGGDDPTMPAWEGALIQTAFVAMGIGLALALPAYLRRRWPRALAGRLGDSHGDGDGGGRTPRWAVAAGVVPGACWLYWAAGGTVGLAHQGQRGVDWHLLTLLGAGWALA
ncbi:hypothetical protein, partial [Streptomyces mayteni]